MNGRCRRAMPADTLHEKLYTYGYERAFDARHFVARLAGDGDDMLPRESFTASASIILAGRISPLRDARWLPDFF